MLLCIVTLEGRLENLKLSVSEDYSANCNLLSVLFARLYNGAVTNNNSKGVQLIENIRPRQQKKKNTPTKNPKDLVPSMENGGEISPSKSQYAQYHVRIWSFAYNVHTVSNGDASISVKQFYHIFLNEHLGLYKRSSTGGVTLDEIYGKNVSFYFTSCTFTQFCEILKFQEDQKLSVAPKDDFIKPFLTDFSTINF